MPTSLHQWARFAFYTLGSLGGLAWLTKTLTPVMVKVGRKLAP